jgi:putative zinc finger protein
MTLSCGEVRDRFEAYGSEALAAGERRGVREHLRSCEPCRKEASAADPLFLFVGAGAAPVPTEAAAGVLAAVRAGIALKTVERRLEVPTARRRLGSLASAAAAVALTLLVPGAPTRQVPRNAAATPSGPAGRSFVPASNTIPAGEILPKAAGTKTYPADATIYDLGSGAGQPRVVWIVDRSLDI